MSIESTRACLAWLIGWSVYLNYLLRLPVPPCCRSSQHCRFFDYLLTTCPTSLLATSPVCRQTVLDIMNDPWSGINMMALPQGHALQEFYFFSLLPLCNHFTYGSSSRSM